MEGSLFYMDLLKYYVIKGSCYWDGGSLYDSGRVPEAVRNVEDDTGFRLYLY
jgi:hypothetical protein